MKAFRCRERDAEWMNEIFLVVCVVQLNETAKQLMEMDKPTLTPGPSTDPCSPAAAPCSGSSAAVSCNGNAGVHRRMEGKKNAKKRHSFTALSMTQRTAQVMGNNRHSMEISAPVLISSSDPRAAARITDCPHLSSSAPTTQQVQKQHQHKPWRSYTTQRHAVRSAADLWPDTLVYWGQRSSYQHMKHLSWWHINQVIIMGYFPAFYWHVHAHHLCFCWHQDTHVFIQESA